MTSIRIGEATLRYTPGGCVTSFADGATWGAQSHDTPHYHVVAHRCGYGDDLLAYCREHEVCHLIVEREMLAGRPGVIRALANDLSIDPGEAAAEELAVMALQRWLRSNERPRAGCAARPRGDPAGLNARCRPDATDSGPRPCRRRCWSVAVPRGDTYTPVQVRHKRIT